MSLIEISRRLRAGIPAWPGDVPFARTGTVEQVGELVCRNSQLTLSAHCGTHLDAPSHLSEEGDPGLTIEGIDPNLLVGPARVLDLRGRTLISAADIDQLEGCPPRVLLRTDNSDRPFCVEGFVALAPEAAERLVSRACLLVGIDGPSIDPAESVGMPSHRVLFSAGLILLEGLDLSRAPAGDYELLCAPLFLEGSEGAPARAWLRPQV